MRADVLKFPPGSILVLTTGEYSDHGIAGILVTIKHCDLPSLARSFVVEKRRDALARGDDGLAFDNHPDNFPSWLVAKGWGMPADTQVVQLGSYGSWEPEFGVSDAEDEEEPTS